MAQHVSSCASLEDVVAHEDVIDRRNVGGLGRKQEWGNADLVARSDPLGGC